MEDDFPWKSEQVLASYELGPSGLSFDYLLNEKPEGDFYLSRKEEVLPSTRRSVCGSLPDDARGDRTSLP